MTCRQLWVEYFDEVDSGKTADAVGESTPTFTLNEFFAVAPIQNVLGTPSRHVRTASYTLSAHHSIE